MRSTRSSDSEWGWIRSPRCLVSLAGLLLVLALACAVAFPVDTRARGILALIAMLTLPGTAIVGRLPITDPLTAGATAVGLSLTVETAAVLAMIWTGWWYPDAAAIALGSGACLVFLRDLGRERRATAREELHP